MSRKYKITCWCKSQTMANKIKTWLNDDGDFYLQTTISNGNVVRLKIQHDGELDNGYHDEFFGENGKTSWVSLYIGPRWKYIFVHDGDISNHSNTPMEGLITAGRLLQYYIDHYMSKYEVLMVGGANERLDRLYVNVLTRFGFRWVPYINYTLRVMIYTKEDAGWLALEKHHQVQYGCTPRFNLDDYDEHNKSWFEYYVMWLPDWLKTEIKEHWEMLRTKVWYAWLDVKRVIRKPKKRKSRI